MKSDSRSKGSERMELECPLCGAPVEILPAQRIDGQPLQCPHCREDITLMRERIEHENREQWKLIEPEFDDERR